jgi:hypothetical protein
MSWPKWGFLSSFGLHYPSVNHFYFATSNMDISMGDVWPPVVPSMTDLPITDPLCVNESCTAFYAAENASQAAIPFDSLGKYAHWMTWYYITILGILALVRVFQLLQDHRPIARKAVNKKPSISQKIMAVGRYIFYRHTAASPFIKPLGLPLNGTLIFLLSTVLFTTILSFAIKPYYRAHLGYGSPPLAIRTGFMAFACIPILIALAGKANLITLFTGISHEKLNILHRWIAWISFGLALTHTIPFLWISYTDGGTANVSAQFFAGNTGRTEVRTPLSSLSNTHTKLTSNQVGRPPTPPHPLPPLPTLAPPHPRAPPLSIPQIAHRAQHNLSIPPLLARRKHARFLGLSMGHSRSVALFLACARVLVYAPD